MDNSDDYFDDDIIFDDEAIAKLDEEESKFIASLPPQNSPLVPTQRSPPTPVAPPAKRQKTTHGWKPQPPKTRNCSLEDLDLPEISVNHSFYGVEGTSQRSGRASQSGSGARAGNTASASNAVAGPSRARPPLAAVAPARPVSGVAPRRLTGELDALRTQLEAAAQAHIAEQAKLRAAKEAAEAKQSQIQMEMKEEMERLKTQFTFKTHEMETSMRKPRLAVPSTPVVSTQTRRWDPPPDAGPSNINMGKRFPLVEHRTPKRPKATAKQNAMLPGFVNAFLPSPKRRRVPPPSPLKDKGKGKGKMPALFENIHADLSMPPPSPPSSPIRPPARSQRADQKMEIEELGDVTMDLDADISFVMDSDMVDEAKEPIEVEEVAEVEPPDWVAQLSQIVFTHASRSPDSNTLQTLLSASGSLGQDAAAYSRASARMLELLGASSKALGFDTLASQLSVSLFEMAFLLLSHGRIAPLTDLFSLLTALMILSPSFIIALLSSQQPSDIWFLLCRTVPAHLLPAQLQSKDEENAEAIGFAHVVLDMMDAICWCITAEYETQLIKILRAPDVLPTLLDPAQPTWFLQRTTRLIALFSSHSSIYRHLLSFPPNANEQGRRRSQGLQSDTEYRDDVFFAGGPWEIGIRGIPLFELHCAHQADDFKGNNMRGSILTALSLLAMTHADALTILSESRTLIPSLIVLLTELTYPLWEEDESLTSSPSRMTSMIRATTQTLMLLHYLVFRPEQTLNLRHKLHHAPHKQFNGISHLFVVTLGRLSFAEPPEGAALESEEKRALEQLAEMAHDLMELVVDGPEAESVWAMYQGSPEREVDEEEMEARMLDVG
ncbi:hypothetical protein EW146_g9545 [Bondarzewia mesenterica]|uniref:DNA repair protein Rad26 n=1 Tax=Bondarzewia mesenterica TaxID=1095465 RepID=A0A4S4L5C4_9AGAM|nr:hypothetical protein EW146_g9545 [Bondarzewia mesenterica]